VRILSGVAWRSDFLELFKWKCNAGEGKDEGGKKMMNAEGGMMN
jgi:hypothetical protein